MIRCFPFLILVCALGHGRERERTHSNLIRSAQSLINMARPTALGGVTGNVQEIALFAALRAVFWRPWCRKCEVAFRTFPVGEVALRADIPAEFA